MIKFKTWVLQLKSFYLFLMQARDTSLSDFFDLGMWLWQRVSRGAQIIGFWQYCEHRSEAKMTKVYIMNNLVEKVLSSCRSSSCYLLIPFFWLKMHSPDQDFRYASNNAFCPWSRAINIQLYRFMGLNDLMAEIRQDPTSFQGDESMEIKVLNTVLSLVEDKISEVKNQAVKWYAD